MRSRSRQAAFTAIELLMVVAVLAILIALLLPALQAAREAARRSQCMNAQKQLAIALLNYESARQRFPLANLAPSAPEQRSNLGKVAPGKVTSKYYTDQDNKPHWNNDGYSWIVQVLPYLEEAPLYDTIARHSENFRRVAFQPNMLLSADVPKSHVASVNLEWLHCPSYTGEPFAQADNNYGLPNSTEVAGGNYVALAAATRGVNRPREVDDQDPKLGGVLISAGKSSRGIRLRDIKDGTSRTMLLTESKQQIYSSWYSGQSSWTIGFLPDKPPTREKGDDGSTVIPTDGRPENRTGLNFGRFLDAPEGVGRWYATTLAGGPRDWGPSSDHAGDIVVHCRTDGSVVAVSDQIDPTIYFRVLTRAGGERVAGGF